MRRASLAFAALLAGALQLPQLAAASADVAATASIAGQPGGARLAPGQHIDPVALELFVDGIVRQAMAGEHIAGVSLAVVQNGRTSLLKGYGLASFSPARPVDPAQTLFRIGSISKTLTWMAVMHEAERGRLELDAPVNDYLPPPLRIPDEGFSKPIRMIDLMSHAAGFDNRDIGRTFAQDPARVVPLDLYLARYRPERVREAGMLSTYSNYGTALAGYVVSRLEGEPFETLIEREITAPLGMTSTTFREPYPARADLPQPMSAALAREVSEGFTWSGSGFRSHAFEHVMIVPAGSVSSTAADMSRFMLMQLNEGVLGDARVYGPEIARAFRTPIQDVPEGVNGWAHGFQVFFLPGGFKGYGHGGATQLFMSNMVLVPELDLGVFVTTNTSTGNPLVARLPGQIVDRFYVAEPPGWPAGDATLVAQADKYAGTYLSTRRAYSGRQKALGLIGAATKVRVTPDGYLVTGGGPSVRRWIPEGAAGHFREVSGPDRLTFALDAKGRATGWISQSGTAAFERAGLLQKSGVLFTVAALVVVVALASWFRHIGGSARRAHPTVWHRWSGSISLAVAASWLVFIALIVAAMSQFADRMGNWPGPLVMLATPTALLGAAGTIALLALLPAIWKAQSAAPQGWSAGARLRHTATATIYACFAFLLGSWGLLTPWD